MSSAIVSISRSIRLKAANFQQSESGMEHLTHFLVP